VIAALLATTLLLGGADADEALLYAEIRNTASRTEPEPEPPPGLRAPENTERHRAAREKYSADLARWEAAERKRRADLIALCGRYLTDFPEGPHHGAVRYLRGVAHFQAGDFAAARADLRAYLRLGAEGPAAVAARSALVASCRALGDFTGALREAGPDPEPELLEEAGRVEAAIELAEKQGRKELAAGWRLIGTKLPIELPDGARAALVESGKRLPEERREALKKAFGEKKLVFVVAELPRPAIYLIDAERVVRAVDPRLDTLTHRITRTLDAK
jgi:hypothetical protein